jgi:hypothetical protein
MPMPERLDRVEFSVGLQAGPIVMPWSVHDDLLDRLKRWRMPTDLESRIRGAGASRTIEIVDLVELDVLRDVLRDWTLGDLPQSARDLYNAVQEELHRLQPDNYP